MTSQPKFKNEGNVVTAFELGSGQLDISVYVQNTDYLSEAENLLRFIVDYINVSKKNVRDDETMPYGCWLIKFRKNETGTLEIWELNENGELFEEGANFTLEIWKTQHEICNHYKSSFLPPDINSLVACSKGVGSTFPLDARRYPAPSHMSGWYLLTGEYNGDINSLVLEHVYHLRSRYAKIFSFLALDSGFGFIVNQDNVEKVWFDEEAAGRTYD